MQQVTLTLNSIVYTPAGASGGKADWVDRSGGVGTSFSYLSEKFYSLSKTGVQRIEHNLNVPVVATDSSACACVGAVLFTNYINTNIGIGPGASAASRLDLYNRFAAYVLTDTFKKSITDMDPAVG